MSVGIRLGSPARSPRLRSQRASCWAYPGGGIALEIVGARYFTDSVTSEQFIVIPKADLREGYRAEVAGYVADTFDLDVIYPDRKASEMVRLAYDDVALSPKTFASLELRADDVHALSVDDDGDGSTDRTLSPRRIFQVAASFSPQPGSWLPVAGATVSLILLACLGWIVGRRWQRRVRHVPAPGGSFIAALRLLWCGTDTWCVFLCSLRPVCERCRLSRRNLSSLRQWGAAAWCAALTARAAADRCEPSALACRPRNNERNANWWALYDLNPVFFLEYRVCSEFLEESCNARRS